MKTYELEAFKKSFILFFVVQFIFLLFLTYKIYNDKIHHIDNKISSLLMQCYLSKSCDKYNTTILKTTNKLQHHLYKEENNIYMIFKGDNILKMTFSINEYKIKKENILQEIYIHTFIYTFILVIISILFAIYTTNPLKKAFKLNDEFIKDILHDINTPLSALRINLKILSREFGNNDAITRSQESIVNILSLQDNMKYYLDQSDLNKEKINLSHTLEEKINFYKKQNDNIYFIVKIKEDIFLNTNQNAINRILDNIISNAIKYNKTNGAVTISFKDNILQIEDTGNGIKNTKKIFDRYYKENENGIGIGLNVVKKLSDSIGVIVTVESEISKGSIFKLDFTQVIFK